MTKLNQTANVIIIEVPASQTGLTWSEIFLIVLGCVGVIIASVFIIDMLIVRWREKKRHPPNQIKLVDKAYRSHQRDMSHQTKKDIKKGNLPI